MLNDKFLTFELNFGDKKANIILDSHEMELRPLQLSFNDLYNPEIVCNLKRDDSEDHEGI